MRFVEAAPPVKRRPNPQMSRIESSHVLGFQEFQEARHSLREPVEDLVLACREISFQHLQKHLDTMFESVEDALTQRAQSARTDQRRAAYYDAVRDIAIKRASFQRAFGEEAGQLFDDFSAGRLGDSPDKQLQQRVEELGLVQEDELAQSLANTNMVWKAENHLTLDLYALNSRFTVINDGIKVNNDSNPVAPAQICRAFQTALQELEIDMKARLVLFKLFDDQVMEELGGLYAAINERLVQGGVLPDLKYRIRQDTYRRRQGSEGPAASRSTAETAEKKQDDFGALTDLLADYRINAVPTGDEASLAGSYSAMELVNALSVLQTDVRSPEGKGKPIDEVVISSTDDLLERIENTGALVPGRELQQQHRDSIDLAAMLFEFILEDQNLPIEIKRVLSRLQIPYVKLAIIDKSYFINKNHSARLLLNDLAQAGMEWSRNNDPENSLYSRIRDVVDRVLRDFDDDPRIFDELVEGFSTYLREAERRARATEKRTTDATAGRERLWTARRKAAVEIMSRIEGTELPEVVSRLLIGPWANVMVLIYLREGEDSEAWKSTLRTVDELIWSVRPKRDESERERLKATLPALHKALRTGLGMATHHEGDLSQLFRSLAVCHARALGPQHRAQPEVETPTTPAPEPHEIPRDDRTLSLMKLTMQAGGAPETSLGTLFGESQPANEEIAEQPPEAPIDEPPVESTPGGAVHAGTDMLSEPADDIGAAFTTSSFVEEVILQSQDEAPVERVSLDESGDEYVKQLQKVRPGAWFELTDDRGRPLRAKLSWVSPITGRFLFVDRKGLKIAEKNLPGLSAELRQKQARILEDVPLFDRAMDVILGRLKGNVPHA